MADGGRAHDQPDGDPAGRARGSCPTRCASRWCGGWRSAGAPVACADLYDSVSKSTASHHFKVLREAGLTERLTIGGQTHQACA